MTHQPIINGWKDVGRLIVMVGLPLSVVSLFSGWFLFGDKIEDRWHRRTFDAVAWKDDVWDNVKKQYKYDRSWPPRLCMVDDLLASSRLKGLTKVQVIELLGPPDRRKFFEFSYYLGPERGFIRIDSETLLIEFDVGGKVRDRQIYRD